MLKLETLQQLVRHDIGGPPSAPHTETSIVNDAGEHLYSMKPWVFAKRRSTVLRFEAGNPLVALPPEFHSVLSLVPGTSSDISWIILGATGQTADVAYSSGSGTGGTFFGHIVYENGLPYIMLAPTPIVDVENAAVLWYRSGWRTLNSPEDVAAVPTFAEGLLKAIIGAFARGYLGDVLYQELAAVRASEPFLSIKRRDGAAQHFGRLRRGIGATQRAYNTLATEPARDPA